MTHTQVKTIDVNGKEWFDKVNVNIYFSIVTFNLTDAIMNNLLCLSSTDMAFYIQEALKQLREKGTLQHTPLNCRSI
jgi:hypothetical protein